jgi:hypothetical protein
MRNCFKDIQMEFSGFRIILPRKRSVMCVLTSGPVPMGVGAAQLGSVIKFGAHISVKIKNVLQDNEQLDV